jgi:alpha-1,3-rhamnosyl/mannosyltransferase
MIKIAFDANDIYGHSGIETYTRELIANLAKLYKEDEFFLFTSKEDLGNLKDVFSSDNLIVKQNLWNKYAFGNPLQSFTGFLNNRIFSKNNQDYDLVHQTNQFFMLNNINNLVVTIHDLIPFHTSLYSKSEGLNYKKNIDYIMNHAKIVFVPSKAVKNDIEEHYPGFMHKVIITPEAASCIFYPRQFSEKTLIKYNLPKDMKYFLFVGRMERRKNLYRTLKAYSNLDEKMKNEIKFVIVGDAKIKYKKIIYSAFPKENDRIYFINSSTNEELAEFYSNALAFLFPSLLEGFGLPLLEAMQCRCPVISSNCSSIPEVAGQAAMLVNPLETEEINLAMRKMCEDDQLRKQYIDLGLERSKLFSWQRTAELTYQGYQMVINNRSIINN